jgi:hypothetical protein
MTTITKQAFTSFKFHFKNFVPYILWSVAISSCFFISYLPYENADHFKGLIISLTFSLFIPLTIYSLYFMAELLEQKGVLGVFTFKKEAVLVHCGLLMGILTALYAQSAILKTSFNWRSIPNTFLTGSFIGFGILFFYRWKNEAKESQELKEINDSLQRKTEQSFLKNIYSKVGEEHKTLKVENIHYFVSKDHYTYAVTDKGEYIVDHSLKELAFNLDPSEFIQIHRSAIVSRQTIESVKSSPQWKVKTALGTELDISRSRKKQVKEFLTH